MKKKKNKRRIRNKAMLLYFNESELKLLKQKAKAGDIAVSKYCRVVILRSLMEKGLVNNSLLLDNLSSDTVELLRVNTGLLINIAKLINEDQQDKENKKNG